MTIGRKIIGGYAIVLAILIVVSAAAFYTFRTIEGAYAEFLDSNTQAILMATALKLEARDQTAQYRGALLFKRPFDFPEPSSVEDAGDVDCNPFHEYARLNLALKRVSGAGDPLAATSTGPALTPIGARALDAAFSMIEAARGRASGPFARHPRGRQDFPLPLGHDGAREERGEREDEGGKGGRLQES